MRASVSGRTIKRRLGAADILTVPAVPAHGTPSPFAAASGRVLSVVFLAAAGNVLLAARLSTPQFPIDHHPGVAAGTVIVALVAGIGSWRYRDRLGQRRLVGLVLLWIGLLAGFVGAITPAGSTVGAEWAALCPLLLAAVFAERRVTAALLAALALVTMVALIVHRVPDESRGMVLAIEVWVAVVVTVVVRVLREVAVRALDTASRGEVTDPLTGLANRRGLERHAPDLWARRAEAHEPVALLVLDIDHFKRINDTRGHAAGDEVIRRVADVVSGCLRQHDIAVRLGGEEFLVLVNAPAGTAAQIGERLRSAVARQVDGVTVSVGVVEAMPDPQDDPAAAVWSAVDVADQAMYQAKRGGRNQVVAAGASGDI